MTAGRQQVWHLWGTTFYYSGGCANLRGEAIRSASGLRLDEFAKRYLFDPLGIERYEWDFINSDFIHASGNLKLCPRDMAKFGQLFLNSGQRGGNQIVSAEWIAAATDSRVNFNWGCYRRDSWSNSASSRLI